MCVSAVAVVMSYADLVLGNRAGFARQVAAGAHRRVDGGNDATPLMLLLLSFHSPVWGATRSLACGPRFRIWTMN